MPARFLLAAGIYLAVAVLSLQICSRVEASESRWTILARKVGQSEENRDRVVRQLRDMRSLTADLTRALKTEDRPLALEVISDLGLKNFVPTLLAEVPTDNDGFVTLTVNSLMDDSNREQIISDYARWLPNLRARSCGAIVAMLEPMGRLGVHLPREELLALKAHSSPEVRDSLLYYLRIMALRQGDRENSDLIEKLAHDSTRQLREHARAVAIELRLEMPLSTHVVAK